MDTFIGVFIGLVLYNVVVFAITLWRSKRPKRDWQDDLLQTVQKYEKSDEHKQVMRAFKEAALKHQQGKKKEKR